MLWHKINCAGRKFYALHVNIEYLMTTIEPTNRTTQAPICFHLPISFRASFIFRYCLFYALFAFFIFIYLFIIYYGEYHLIEWDFSAVFFLNQLHFGRENSSPIILPIWNIKPNVYLWKKCGQTQSPLTVLSFSPCLSTLLLSVLSPHSSCQNAQWEWIKYHHDFESERKCVFLFFAYFFFSTIENAVLYWNTFTPHLFHLSLSVFLHRFWFDWLNLFKMSPIYNWMCVYVQTNDFAVLLFCQSLLFLVPLHVHHIPKWNVFILNRVDQLEFNWRRKKNAKTNSFQCSHTSTKKDQNK